MSVGVRWLCCHRCDAVGQNHHSPYSFEQKHWLVSRKLIRVHCTYQKAAMCVHEQSGCVVC